MNILKKGAGLAVLTIFISSLATGLVGCGQDDSMAVGTWNATDSKAQLVLKADHSFTIPQDKAYFGRWEMSGKAITMFRDVRNGGDVGFGEGTDGAAHFTLSADGKKMVGDSKMTGVGVTFLKQ